MRNNLINMAGIQSLVYADITALHVGSMELNTVRPFFVETASQLFTLNALTAASSGASQNDSSLYSSQPSGRHVGENGQPNAKYPRYDTQSQ